jgi:DNA-binding GntR family transcriptional regulator
MQDLLNQARGTQGLVKENLAVQLREEILAGRIAPGEKIIEGTWARQSGVAQSSVREALNILVGEGFVTKGHGRSARVVKLSECDIIQIYQVRGVLEGLAARLAAAQQLPLTNLEAVLAQMREAVQINDVRKVVGSVLRFHLTLLEMPKSQLLLEQATRLIVPLYAFTLMRARAKNLDASPWAPHLAHHQQIVDAIRTGNPYFAENMVVHLVNQFLESALTVWAH